MYITEKEKKGGGWDGGGMVLKGKRLFWALYLPTINFALWEVNGKRNHVVVSICI